MAGMINYGLIGFSGKMGEEISKLFSENGYVCVLKVNTTTKQLLDDKNIDVLIDFSSPNALLNSIELSRKFKSPLIVGTTGLNDSQISLLKNLSNSVPVVQSYNFSTGIQLLLKVVEFIKRYTNNWSAEIVEMHHIFKKDKPSGTALMLREKVGDDVQISSLRIGGVPGDHKVIFGNLGEVLEISHRAISRRAFAEGVLKAVQFVREKSSGFYSYSDVLFSKGDDFNV